MEILHLKHTVIAHYLSTYLISLEASDKQCVSRCHMNKKAKKNEHKLVHIIRSPL